MSFDAIVVPLLNAPIFAGLDPLQLKSIAVLAERVVFDDGIDIIRDGEAGEAAYVIASGDVVVRASEGEDPIEIELGPGTVVGELAMFVDMFHETTVTARGEVHALRIERSAILDAMAQDPALSERVVELMSKRLEALAARLREVDSTLASWQGDDARPAVSLN